MIDRDRDNRDIDRWIRGNLLEELAHTISKFKTCLNLPSASGKKIKKAGSIILSRCKGLRTKGSAVEFYCLSTRSSDVQCLSAEEGWASWRRGRENLPFLCLFVLRRPSVSWMMSAHTGEGNPLIQMLISLRNTITDTSGNNALPAPWAFLSPLKLIHKNKICALSSKMHFYTLNKSPWYCALTPFTGVHTWVKGYINGQRPDRL